MNMLTFLAAWDLGQLFLILGVIIIIFSLLIARKKSKSNLSQYRDELRSLGKQDVLSPTDEDEEQKLRASVEELFGQVQSYSHDVIQRLDTKMRMLNMLIIDAEKKINELRQEMEKLKKLRETSFNQGNVKPLVENPTKYTEKNNQQQTLFFDEKKPSESKPQEELKDIVDENVTSQITNIYDKVYSLYDSSCDVEEIAKKLNIPEGEVKLIIGMRKVGNE